ncbi:hypothetical protein TVAG_173620 [Trichomonas vaginalis G3]|uniref:Leucine Rich Repeat family protein n=1 Tax=Trichomonas vaginalis (strain ATCC PRA-98 / G3) TaxID=412133 RepID=A2EVI5_TRIV3|nr:ribonuclease inhibitor domain-containing protein [Trichomonas vaginalis G3]EAY03317.1 hypothetical protein TVAG_173620 [Trichomonas vaginalis G3]KAI5498344.1 ribonuclease inhibitor domain-containing protein [Trichomonas vaginalis G3]|eukprot:XP_001315540.1 hypothetical protein [Trichomonas vaginalis G3]
MSTSKSKIPPINQGRLDLTGMGLTSLDEIPVSSKLRELILTDNQITSFKSLQPQPNLTTIIANRNPIKYLTGLDKMPALTSIDLTETPLEKNNDCVVRILYTIGPKLQYINKNKVTEDDQTRANIYEKKNIVEKKYLPLESEEDEDLDQLSPIEKKSFEKISPIYIQEMSKHFADIAYNEAKLYDLKQFGMMPVITEDSTFEDKVRTIVHLKKRINLLADEIDKNLEE